MKFYEALREMQENGKRCYIPRHPGKHYYWGDVLDIPCLKNSLGEEVLANSYIMNADWEIYYDGPKSA